MDCSTQGTSMSSSCGFPQIPLSRSQWYYLTCSACCPFSFGVFSPASVSEIRAEKDRGWECGIWLKRSEMELKSQKMLFDRESKRKMKCESCRWCVHSETGRFNIYDAEKLFFKKHWRVYENVKGGVSLEAGSVEEEPACEMTGHYTNFNLNIFYWFLFFFFRARIYEILFFLFFCK